MIFLRVEDLIKSVRACLIGEYSCGECAFYNCDRNQNCQYLLAEAVENKFGELVNLLDDKVNHHYYDTLEHYQEESIELRDKIDKVLEIIKE